uniref:Uncharacterized protein n=1 Tax=Moniliophthora roreri TaxID=221103 RepID=A0A0W0FCW0_MONRR
MAMINYYDGVVLMRLVYTLAPTRIPNSRNLFISLEAYYHVYKLLPEFPALDGTPGSLFLPAPACFGLTPSYSSAGLPTPTHVHACARYLDHRIEPRNRVTSGHCLMKKVGLQDWRIGLPRLLPALYD